MIIRGDVITEQFEFQFEKNLMMPYLERDIRNLELTDVTIRRVDSLFSDVYVIAELPNPTKDLGKYTVASQNLVNKIVEIVGGF